MFSDKEIIRRDFRQLVKNDYFLWTLLFYKGQHIDIILTNIGLFLDI